jgi:hypothetical protein
MNQMWGHIVVFVATLGFLLAVILTGHGNDPLLTTLLTGAVGGSGGAALGGLLKGFFGNEAPLAPSNQKGFARVEVLIVVFALAFAALMSACTTSGGTAASTNAQTIQTSCASASAAIKALTVVEQAGYLSASDKQAVSDAISVVTPICGSTTQPSDDDVEVQVLSDAVSTLTSLETKYHASATGS